MSRCYGCCQENCDSRPHCGCSCHAEKIQIDLSDPEIRATWNSALEAKKEVDSWPEWKRGHYSFTSIPPKCQTHKQYQAKRRPRTDCEACWRLYIKEHP